MRLKLMLFVYVMLIIMRGAVMAGDGVFKKVLDNGLTVIIEENRTVPVAAVNFWLKAGSVFEDENEKGMMHFIEHMLFKGTEKRGLGIIDKEIKEMGGYNNAFTSYDATNYIIVMPSENILKAIEIQYDALTASVFDKEELEKEREVILTELHRGKDSPYNMLWQNFMKLAFDEKYSHPIIGYEHLIKRYTRPQIMNFWKKYYLPQNLVVVVSGDVDAEKVYAKIKETFGKIPKKGRAVDIAVPGDENEIFTRGIKFGKFSGNIHSRYFAVGFRIPDALSEDIPKLEVLARVLGGTESSVLYKRVKEEDQLVDDVSADIFSGKFGGVFMINGAVRKNKFGKTIKTIFEEAERLKRDGIQPAEIQRVKADIVREEEKEKMKVENAAMNLGHYETLGDYRLYREYFEALKRVIDQDLEAVLEKYIHTDNLTVCVYYPESAEKEFEKYKKTEHIKELAAVGGEKIKGSPEGVSVTALANGIPLIYKKVDDTDIVAANFIFKGGMAYEGVNSGYYKGITNLMVETMMKGTRSMDAEEVAEKIDELGAVIDSDIKKDFYGWDIEVLRNNFSPAAGLLSEIIREPALKLSEIRKEKTDIKNRIKRRKDNPASHVSKLFNELLFEWHHYGFPVTGEEATVNRIPSRVLRQHHRTYVDPANMMISVVGNIELEKVKNILNEHFGKWKKGREQNFHMPVKITRAKKYRREETEKEQVHVMLGFPGPSMRSSDYTAFRVLNTILSGGMDSRLFTEIREKRNLCYSIYSSFDRTMERGAFRIYGATAPENEEKLIDEILNVLRDIKKNGVEKKEVRTAKAYINGMYKIGFQDYGAQADAYLNYELFGLGAGKVDSFPGDIKKVAQDDVAAVIKKYIDIKNYTLAVVGPKKK
ncbi:MAG: M16 family metallopeptidase [Candidatus Goldiibacteriota bacterium]